MRGLNFAIPPEKIGYSKFLLPFEFLFRDIKSNSEFSVDLASVKACLQDTAFTSYSAFNKDKSPPFNLSKDEFESLYKFKNENNLVIQKAGEGNTPANICRSSRCLENVRLQHVFSVTIFRLPRRLQDVFKTS